MRNLEEFMKPWSIYALVFIDIYLEYSFWGFLYVLNFYMDEFDIHHMVYWLF